ncbi:hypothetical protein ACFYWO_13880 [Streptomyces sp. NPDC002932]|uniref:hypothetical protein n=1 Tax=Streptomyces sp. NPDC002932 TaxID=3364672 RepID=UPI0036913637
MSSDIILMADPRVAAIPVHDNGEPLRSTGRRTGSDRYPKSRQALGRRGIRG